MNLFFKLHMHPLVDCRTEAPDSSSVTRSWQMAWHHQTQQPSVWWGPSRRRGGRDVVRREPLWLATSPEGLPCGGHFLCSSHKNMWERETIHNNNVHVCGSGAASSLSQVGCHSPFHARTHTYPWPKPMEEAALLPQFSLWACLSSLPHLLLGNAQPFSPKERRWANIMEAQRCGQKKKEVVYEEIPGAVRTRDLLEQTDVSSTLEFPFKKYHVL